MAFNVNEFINTAFPYDGFRPNLFDIQIFVGHPTPNPFTFRFKAKATTIPGSTVAITPVSYYGRQVKLAGNRTFDNWTVTVMVDEDDFNGVGTRGAFELWSSRLNRHVNNNRNMNNIMPNTGGYFGEAEIWPYKKDAPIPVQQYRMRGCWPMDIGPIGLDWQDNDRVAEFNVTFAYQWWENNAVEI